MVSQGLLGAVVGIRRSVARGEWLQVKLPDGYAGWLRSWHLIVLPRRDVFTWRDRADALVIAPSAEVLTGKRIGASRIRDLTLGNRLVTRQKAGSWVRVALPDGERGWVGKGSLLLDGKTLPAKGPDVLKTARLFLGAPYLWGGVTPRGADCSGLVQTAFAVHGERLPRDVVDQCRCGVRVEGRLRPGDLLFFGPSRGPLTHVAIWAGGRRFIHAGCPVELASLDPREDNYRPKLKAQYRFSMRVL
jgi:cell wall-associated NlpC family hydrolase